uniref:ycf49-like protein isoform X2 n=1 Tax=Erigeron canadensis TaxID=72917 RepID=UPI001CB9A0E0|nr:ycf49-like protein isoform X2 [Erigeron canadensis]
MTILPTLLSSSNPFSFSRRILPKTPKSCYPKTKISRNTQYGINNKKAMAALMGAGFALTTPLFVGPASVLAAELPLLVGSSMQLTEPSNALSLPTWAIHVSSVVEWVAAMILVWQYGEKSGYQSWKGLSWGMVPLLGGAFCACTWHFFYNSESLEILVAIQGALTVIGNTTMCIAAYKIYKSSQERSTE